MWKWSKRIVLAFGALLLLLAATVWLLMRGSLPQLDGELALPGLSALVQVQRDALGIVTIDAESEADMVRALGYVHAQERYFEMDLMRRSAAGELAALFGPRALEVDRRNRLHRMRARANRDVAALPAADRAVLHAYAEGANAGLADLRVRPWPYLLLRQAPVAWQPVDSLLAAQAMYFDLQDSGNQRELGLWRIRQVVSPALYALLAHDGSQWDAPLTGPTRGDAMLPGADQLDLRKLPNAEDAAAAAELESPGSNNFAVAGGLTDHGHALVADDMHLGLRAPNIWFRARLRYPDTQAPDGRVDVSGFTLPGLPAVIVGSNGHVAWGFTNGYIDTADFAWYAPGSASGQPDYTEHDELLQVAGGDAETLKVRETRWGPLTVEQADGSELALRWTAHLPGAVNLELARFARAADLEQLLAMADRVAMPAQNLVAGDSDGRIAWRLVGGRAERGPGCDAAAVAGYPQGDAGDAGSQANAAPSTPAVASGVEAPALACEPWPARLDQAPALLDPVDGRLWTANSRVMDPETMRQVGDGGYDLGARARQIRDGLRSRESFDEHALLAIQLDDRAVFLQRWYHLLRAVVAGSDDPALRRVEAATRRWQGQASVDSASYRLVRGFRGMVLEKVHAGLLAPARAALGDEFVEPRLPQVEGVLWPLVTERPIHLLPPPHASWEDLLRGVARELAQELARPDGTLADRSWGERNTASICHPLAGALPLLGPRWLCMPAEPLPGDSNLPRVQGPSFGASQRMVVAPGRESAGIIHMPGGQSGHPLSPSWGAGHDDWVQGRPTPFLPGATQFRMTLQPR